jgi:beta-lactamase regulating signal transducer with metallopeptidase domain
MPWIAWIASNVALAAGIAAAALFVQRRLRMPAAARVLWVLVLVKLVTPPAISVSAVALPASLVCALGACGCEQHAGVNGLVRDRLPWLLLAIWSAGAAAALVMIGLRWARFQRLTSHARPAPREWRRLASRLARELSLRQTPAILVVPGRLPPLVVPGWQTPRLLLPAALLGKLDRPQREALLLHELVHIKRRDYWARLLETAVRVAYWWLPAVGAIGRRLRDCEETCCDAAVVSRRPRFRRDYARLLLDVIDFAQPLPAEAAPQATAMGAMSGVEQRVRAILADGRASRRRSSAGLLVVGAACAMLPCGVGYEFVAPPASAALEGCEPADGGALRASSDRAKLSAFCCP